MNEKPCPLCAGTSYRWGEIRAQGLRFAPEDEGWLSTAFAYGTAMRARRCDTCQNVQLFADMEP